jgi:hypothetical protein
MAYYTDDLVTNSSGNFGVGTDLTVGGLVGIGGAASSASQLTVQPTGTSGSIQYGVSFKGADVFPGGGGASSYIILYHSGANTTDGSRGTSYVVHYYADLLSLGTGHSVGREIKFFGNPAGTTGSTHSSVLADTLNVSGRSFIYQLSNAYPSYFASDIHYTGANYGFIHDTGLWKDLRFPAQGINPAGSAAPPEVSTTTGMLMFDKAGTEIIAGVAQMPHGWKSASNVSPHVHGMADVSTNPRASATATAADGVTTNSTNYFTSATGGFTGHENEYLVITTTGTNSKAVVGNYQVQTVVSDTNVLLTTFPGGNVADDSVTWAIYPDTVALKVDYAVKDVGESWDQSTYSAKTKYFQLAAVTAGNAVHQLMDFTHIDMTGKQDSCLIFWRISRIGGDTHDTYNDDFHLAEFDIHYLANTLGSVAETGDNF